MNIYLTGFMASGKSTIGPILAAAYCWDFIDLDRMIEEEYGMPVRKIFETFGESEFRKEEKRMLSRVAENHKQVVALGGGALLEEDNFRLLGKEKKLIWLKPDPGILAERIKNSENRPLAQGPESPEELYRKRVTGYEKADIIVPVSESETPEETVRKIREILDKDDKL
jgi:shikimate kinase